jgi:2-polyprenyl-3-methyl-5-hydroxy-6-metoxy-1,4-benzoquinol methylase
MCLITAKMGIDREDLRQEWAGLAAPFIKRVREGDSVREGLIDPVMLDLCGPVEGLEILECGCGEGRFCRMLASAGARRVLGLDLSLAMIEAAVAMKSANVEYRIADVQDLRSLKTRASISPSPI